jgi:hypothetical protein
MDVTGGVAATKTLLSIAAKIAAAVTRANDEKLEPERRVVLYLEVAREAVNALGLERQRILSMARRCNIRKPKQVEALWARLDTYLHEDNVRPQLEKAVRGLQACAEPIKKHTEGIKWRKRDKQAAVAMFLSTCGELEQVLTELAHHFYPGSSGMGVGTLLPIEHQLREIRDFQREKEKIDPGVEDEKLA